MAEQPGTNGSSQPLLVAREHIAAEFDEHAIERGLHGLSRRIVRRKRLAQGGTLLVALTLVGLGWLGVRDSSGPIAATSTELRTTDGFVATRVLAETTLSVERDTPDEVALHLARGKSHFEVTRNPKRRYRVRAGRVDVQVLGTGFDVEQRAEQTHVRVQHGLVRVSWPTWGSALLHAGEQGLFPPQQVTAAAPRVVEPAAEPALVLPEPSAVVDEREIVPAPSRESWRKLARAGRHKEAFGTLGKKPVSDLDGLLLAADAARLSGHPREAVSYLQRLVQRYPKSAPARLAAFTLGRLALNELNEPALAARSFARAYRIDPSGPLAEDALAREAEAYHRAGDAERAKSAAQRYVTRYPGGAHEKELARYLR